MSWVLQIKSYYVDNTVIGFTLVNILSGLLFVEILLGPQDSLFTLLGESIRLVVVLVSLVVFLVYFTFLISFVSYYGRRLPFYSAYATMLFNWVFNPVQRKRRVWAFLGKDTRYQSVWHFILLLIFTIYVYWALSQSGFIMDKESATTLVGFYRDFLFFLIPVAIALVSYLSNTNIKHQIIKYNVGGWIPIVFLVISSFSIVIAHTLTASWQSEFHSYFSDAVSFMLVLAFFSLMYPFIMSLFAYRRDEPTAISSYTKQGIAQYLVPEIQKRLMVDSIDNRTPQNISCRLDPQYDSYEALVTSNDLFTEGDYIIDVDIRKLREVVLKLDESTNYLLVLPIEKQLGEKEIPILSCQNMEDEKRNIEDISTKLKESVQVYTFSRLSQGHSPASYYQGINDLEQGCKRAIDNQNPLEFEDYLSQYEYLLNTINQVGNQRWNDIFLFTPQFDFSPFYISIQNITDYILDKNHVHREIIKETRYRTKQLERLSGKMGDTNIEEEFAGIRSRQERLFDLDE